MRSRFLLPLILLSCAAPPASSSPEDIPIVDFGTVNFPPAPSSSLSPDVNHPFSLQREFPLFSSGMLETGLKACGKNEIRRCALAESCTEHSDCLSQACDYSGKCIADKSCTAFNGGATCGVGEADDPNKKWESCCTVDRLPSGVLMDRYLLTAGRARTIIEREKGNLKDWYLSHRDQLNSKQQAQIDPYVDTLPTDMRLGEYSIVALVNGGNIYEPDVPSKVQGCFEAPGEAGTHTYWLSPEDNALFGDTNGYDQEVLDPKPLNCAPYILFAALCVYDGGRLPTFDEAKEAWGTDTYPWGNAPVPGGFSETGYVSGPATLGPWGPTDPACPGCDTSIMNWTNVYQVPDRDPKIDFDYSRFISAPGRFPKDKGKFGTFDLGGDLIEWTSSLVDGYVDAKGRPQIRLNGSGTWEGHPSDYWLWAMPPRTKYAKFGGRCIRD